MLSKTYARLPFPVILDIKSYNFLCLKENIALNFNIVIGSIEIFNIESEYVMLKKTSLC